ncbi:heavy metal translocating P-type ATPase [Methylicorpusculum oleiharenae]|uniref:heavy metal translocating P-type ATPase n=1 Tax=Methylicorpusculum oleiharenae TaxID=1338687 RepID=UPI0013DE50EF
MNTTTIDKPEDNSISLMIEGMTCMSCVGRLENALRKVEGVVHVSVNLATESALVRVSKAIDVGDLVQAVKDIGYFATRRNQRANNKSHRHVGLAVIFSALLSLPLMAPMLFELFGIHFMLPGWLQMVLATPVQFGFGARFYRAGWKALKAGVGNMDLLVALGTSAAYGLSVYQLNTQTSGLTPHLYFEASAVVISLVLAGKWLEAWAKNQTASAIRALQVLQPATARVRRDGIDRELAIADVKLGDWVIVRPGERISVDGTIIEGHSHIDESLITGESVPVPKQPGDKVTGGAINTDGLIIVHTGAVGSETALSRIIRLIENAQSAKAPIQHLVDKVSAWFVPGVLIIALITFIGWWYDSGNIEMAIINAVSVLVIACPCALGLATPTALIAGTGVAAKYGILIKDAEALEIAHSITTVIFDKTGTLTQGKAYLVENIPFNIDRDRLLQLAVSMQNGSGHPLAKAVIDAADALSIDPLPATNSKALPGKGIAANVDGLELRLGNSRLMSELGIELRELAKPAVQFERWGNSISWLAEVGPNNRILGMFAFGDKIKPSARHAVQRLQALGIYTVLLTGDNSGSAVAVGSALGIEHVVAEVLPDEKANQVALLKQANHRVAMVGDGINDAPALATADVGIAMASGTDVAMHTAGITLMNGDPCLVGDAIDISRRTYRKIMQNLFWAFGYNLAALPLAAFGLLNPQLAGAAMAFSSLSVIGNALLLRGWKPAGHI